MPAVIAGKNVKRVAVAAFAELVEEAELGGEGVVVLLTKMQTQARRQREQFLTPLARSDGCINRRGNHNCHEQYEN